MHRPALLIATSLFMCACAAETQTQAPWNPLQDYEEIDTATVVSIPKPQPGSFAPETRGLVERGEYLVKLLACGSCHTDGALDGAPDPQRSLAGSGTGIAFTNPMGEAHPGVVYPPNLTPDIKTGIGSWSDQQVATAIRSGKGRHGTRRIATMPWQGYAQMSSEDVDAVVAYLRSIKPVRHRVPDEVIPGETATEPFVYFGVYRSRQ